MAIDAFSPARADMAQKATLPLADVKVVVVAMASNVRVSVDDAVLQLQQIRSHMGAHVLCFESL